MGKGWFRPYGLRVFIFKPYRLEENLEGCWEAALNHASGDARERMGGFKPSRLEENLKGYLGAALNHASGDARERMEKGWFRPYGLRVFIFKPSRLEENLEGYLGGGAEPRVRGRAGADGKGLV